MNIIDWSEAYSVNINEIDKQHKQLIDIINTLHAAMLERKSTSVMSEILDELVRYTDEHFAYEEKLLESYDYPNCTEHKQVHAAMRKEVLQLHADQQAGKVIVSAKVMHFLKDWLATHILGNDQLYKDFLNGEGIF